MSLEECTTGLNIMRLCENVWCERVMLCGQLEVEHKRIMIIMVYQLSCLKYVV